MMEVLPAADRDVTKELSGAEKLARAKEYWRLRLDGEHRIEAVQSPRCEFAIVVPVYNERTEGLLKQLESLRQQSVDSDSYEIIYVVNNDTPDASPASPDLIKQNAEIMAVLRSIEDLPIRIIDKSSPGNEIKGCNVGRARNRGLAEASLRFHESGKNGIVVQTDADTRFEDRNFLQKIGGVLRDHPDIIGIAGGLVFEFNPDSKDTTTREELKRRIERVILQKKWSILKNFLFGKKGYSPVADTTFAGANMISRSFESAVIGGLIDANKGEDPRFGQDLSAYASSNHGRVIGMKDELRVVTALRESDRTEASFRRYFENAGLTEPIIVSDPEAPAGVQRKIHLDDKLIEKYEEMAASKEGGSELLAKLKKIVEEVRIEP